MTEALDDTKPQTTTEDLSDAGFSDEQIRTLEALRNKYPFIEFLESDLELQRLRFMKWLYRKGDFGRGDPTARHDP